MRKAIETLSINLYRHHTFSLFMTRQERVTVDLDLQDIFVERGDGSSQCCICCSRKSRRRGIEHCQTGMWKSGDADPVHPDKCPHYCLLPGLDPACLLSYAPRTVSRIRRPRTNAQQSVHRSRTQSRSLQRCHGSICFGFFGFVSSGPMSREPVFR